MKINDIENILKEAQKITNHKEYIIIGSISILGAVLKPPNLMVLSNDLDLYPKYDPGRALEIKNIIGKNSEYAKKNIYYADAALPQLANLPEGWKNRLNKLDFESGVIAWCLEPHDAAISKYARYEDRDKRWIRSGLKAKILTIPTLEYRLRETIMELDDMEKAKKALARDKQYIRNLNSTGPK